ncbi:CapA family protein [Cytobacillus solani]|uniref:CapA family protein n=1 Tax=Cytobacillus solani TaxID=1637975 RepID=UPI0006ABDED8|nr:CapA family protein [Cytobacillus solani]KOP82396.1 capsular biosynthesis protein [Bacillus sp. FJAT-21945]USK57322.1 CapA family protein [Cytobacillus solani]
MKRKLSFLFSILFCIALITLSSLLILNMYKESKESEFVFLPIQSHEPRITFVEAKTYSETITLGAIGDILIHDWVYNDAKTSAGYDFTPMFQHIKQTLQQPDLLLANQETILGGNEIGISSYPLFNSPQEIGDALKDAGVDIVSTANNHSLDKGEKGLVTSLHYLDTISLPHVGTNRNASEKQQLKILNSKGIQVAYLSYTYGTNGIPVPNGKEFLVNLIDRKAMKEEITRAKKEADIIVMSIHWGNEYQRFPNVEQKELAQFLADEGIDIVFGHHPHVLQPMEWRTGADGHQTLVVYSLGNFISGQNNNYKDIGGMATIEVTKTVDTAGVNITLKNPHFYPTYVSNIERIRNYRVVPLMNADKFGMKNAKTKYKEIQQHMLGNLSKFNGQ